VILITWIQFHKSLGAWRRCDRTSRS